MLHRRSHFVAAASSTDVSDKRYQHTHRIASLLRSTYLTKLLPVDSAAEESSQCASPRLGRTVLQLVRRDAQCMVSETFIPLLAELYCFCVFWGSIMSANLHFLAVYESRNTIRGDPLFYIISTEKLAMLRINSGRISDVYQNLCTQPHVLLRNSALSYE